MSVPAHPVMVARSTQAGLTLIELMVAMALGLIVTLGVVAIFQSTSSSHRAQAQLARLQEEGRFAVTSIKRDLEMAGGLYCNSSGGAARPVAASQLYLDGLRAPMIYSRSTTSDLADVTTLFGSASGRNTYPPEPAAPYPMPAYWFMRGYDCDTAACKPVEPQTMRSAGLFPRMGKEVNDRVVGADVITVRYVDTGRGWAIGGGGTSMALDPRTGAIDSITIRPLAGEPPASEFMNDMAMLADCSQAQVIAVRNDGRATLKPDHAYNYAPLILAPSSTRRLYDFERGGFQVVTYYVKVVANGDGHTTGALVRRVNGGEGKKGGTEDELVRGVERLDFRYGIQDADGKLHYVTADAVDAGTGIPCPPGEPGRITTVGCLWRAVSSIEVNLVMSGQVPLYTLLPGDLAYTYGIDRRLTPTHPSDHKIKPRDQGFPEQVLRREFTAVVAVRNFNP